MAPAPLTLQRLGDLVEQPRVPDGDGSPVGEVFEGGDLRGVEQMVSKRGG
jgi:hypothetical protein